MLPLLWECQWKVTSVSDVNHVGDHWGIGWICCGIPSQILRFYKNNKQIKKMYTDIYFERIRGGRPANHHCPITIWAKGPLWTTPSPFSLFSLTFAAVHPCLSAVIHPRVHTPWERRYTKLIHQSKHKECVCRHRRGPNTVRERAALPKSPLTHELAHARTVWHRVRLQFRTSCGTLGFRSWCGAMCQGLIINASSEAHNSGSFWNESDPFCYHYHTSFGLCVHT